MIAEAIIENFDKSKASIEKIEIAGPGFINFYMNNAYLTELIPVYFESWMKHMVKQLLVTGEKIQVEFVSANPTGDLHLRSCPWCSSR